MCKLTLNKQGFLPSAKRAIQNTSEATNAENTARYNSIFYLTLLTVK